MTVPQFQVVYAAWNWYRVELRQLLPEEVQDMAAIYYRTDYPTKKALELAQQIGQSQVQRWNRSATETFDGAGETALDRQGP